MLRVKPVFDQSPTFWFFAGSTAAVVYRRVPRPFVWSFALGVGAALVLLERTGSAALTLRATKPKPKPSSPTDTNDEETSYGLPSWLTTLPSLPSFSFLPSTVSNDDVCQLRREIADLRSLIHPAPPLEPNSAPAPAPPEHTSAPEPNSAPAPAPAPEKIKEESEDTDSQSDGVVVSMDA